MADDNQPTPPPRRQPISVGGKQIKLLSTQEERDQEPPATFSNAVASIKSEDFYNIGQRPCARQGLMNGIMGGFGVGAIKIMFRGKVPQAANWAVATFVVVSLGNYEYCRYKRRVEKRTMQHAYKLYTEKMRELEKKRLEEEQARKLEAERKAAAERRWYKFW